MEKLGLGSDCGDVGKMGIRFGCSEKEKMGWDFGCGNVETCISEVAEGGKDGLD